jgi:diacylglycerol kinase (ATP)
MILPEKPARVTGVAHFMAAARYSAAGLSRLWRESAFRQEVAGGALVLIVLLIAGASLAEVAGFVILWLILAAVETLNTALEVLVDQASPGWSALARDAKDLGSLAVALLIGANAIYVLCVLFT